MFDASKCEKSTSKWGSERIALLFFLGIFLVFFAFLAHAFSEDAQKAAAKIATASSEGKWASVKDYANYGTHRFALVNTGILLLVALTIKLWHKSWRAQESHSQIPTKPHATKGFYLWLILIVGIAGLLRFPLANGGFWHDEGLQMKRAHGVYEKDDADPTQMIFRPSSWFDTLFHYRKPTNHTAVGVPGRLALETWRNATDKPREQFSEFIVRLPSFITALASVFLIGLLGKNWGGQQVGIFAALLLAVHPWHIHWGVDLRAYGIGIFSVLLSLYGLNKAMQSGTWSDWSIFGLGQMLIMWSSFMNLWVAGALFLVAVFSIWRQKILRPWQPQAGRLMLVNTVAATLFLQVMGPNLMQFLEASKRSDPSVDVYSKLDLTAALDLSSHLFLGLPHDVPTVANDEPIETFLTMFQLMPWLGYALLFVAIGVLLWGLIASLKHNPLAGKLLIAVLFAGSLHLILTILFNWYYYPRFSTYLLPIVVLGWSLGWSAIARAIGTRREGFVLAIGLVVFLATAHPQLINLVRYTHEPFPELRDTFVDLRAKSPSGKALTACYGLAGDILQDIYDPNAQFIRSAEEIQNLMNEADRSGSPLYIAYGLQSFNRSTLPDGFKLLDDRELFSMVHRFVSNDPRHTFFLLEYIGNSQS